MTASQPGWTKGPWEKEPGAARGAWIKNAEGEWTALACGDTDESAQRHADLIKAAPSLYEALEGLMKSLRIDPVERDLVPKCTAEITAARAALALARGEQP